MARTKTIKTRLHDTNPGANLYENPVLRVDEDADYEYVEDDNVNNGLMAVARTPHWKGERPSLKAAEPFPT